MQYRISRAKGAREKNWKMHSYTWDELHTNGFDFHRESDSKDGPAFMPACLIGSQRKAPAVEELSLFVYDIDGTQTYAEVRECIVKAGLEAIIYTTYNHKTTKTFVRTDQYAKWAQKNRKDEKHTDAGVRQYLQEKQKAHLKVKKVHTTPVQSADGINILIEHEPIDKTRVILPMVKPFIIAEAGYTHAEAVQVWKRTYVGIGKALGLDFDLACVDVTRLHYYPSHPADAAEFKIERLTGNLIDHEKFALADLADTHQRHRETSPTGTLIDDDTVIVEGFDVGAWFFHQGRGIGGKLLEALAKSEDGIVKGERGGEDKPGNHILCPFESEHSTPGGDGTFLDPGDEDSYPKIFCCHSHCSGRRTEHFLGGILEQGWMTREELLNIGSRAPQEHALASIGLNPATLAAPIKADEIVEPDVDISGLGPASVDEGQLNIIAQIKAMAEKNLPLPEGIIEQLEKARAGIEVKAYIAESVKRGSEDTRAHAIFCLAASGMSMRGVKMYYGVYASDIGLNHLEFIEIIKHVRNKIRALESRVNTVANASLQNYVLRDEIRYLAEYYDVPYTEVYNAYLKARNDVSSEVVTELNRRAGEMNDRYAKWQKATDTYIIDIPKTLTAGVVCQFTKNSLIKIHSNERVEQKAKKGESKKISVFDYWFDQWPMHTIYDNVVFDPAMKVVPRNTLNVFFGFNNVQPHSGDASPILDHLRNIWCRGDEKIYHWLITYMANIFQFPGKKYPTAVAVIGAQGGGKSLVFEKGLKPMAHPYCTVSARRDDIAGRFNSAMENRLIFVAEESTFAGDHQTSSKLKSLISEGTLTVERKGLEPETCNNLVRFFFLSNDMHALKLEADDRRFLVLEISKERVGDMKYFQNLANWLDNGGREIWLDYLLKWNPASVHMSWDDLHNAPRTTTKVRQISHSLGPVEHFLRNLAMLGYVEGVKEQDLTMGNIRWMLDSECVVLERKWNLVWDAYLRAQPGGGKSTYLKTHLVPTAQKLLGDGAKFRVAKKLVENDTAKAFTVLCPRREALDKLLHARVISQEEYDSSIALGDGDSE